MRCHPAQVAAEYRDRGWWSGDTFDGLLRARVAAAPERLCLIDPPNTPELIGHEPMRLSWAELDRLVDAVAAGLADAGVRAGDVVAVQLPNCAALVATLLGVVRLGAIVTPFPLSYRENELGRMCAQTGAAVAVTVPSCVDRYEGVPARVLLWDRDLPGSDAAPEVRVADPNECVTVCWTSGTEAEPKAVPRCHGDWLVMADGTRFSGGLGADDVLLSPFPMTNMAGISGMFLPWLQVGGVFVPHHPFDLQVFLGQIASERATYTVAPPAVLTMLLHNRELLSSVDISSLRLIGSGSAPLSTWVVEQWERDHGVQIINFFGSNEGVGLTADPIDVPDPKQRATLFPNFSAAGVRWRNPVSERIAMRLVDPDTEREITEPGTPGELRLTGPNVFPGYLGDGTDTPLDRSPFDEAGYFRSGDVFEIAGERNEFLRFVDRAKDLIIRGGMNISPASLETLLVAHPSVADVAVIGVADEVLGERVCAIVVPVGEPPTLADLVEFLREQRIASYRLPQRLELTDVLPRNPVGKVLKRELREIYDPARRGGKMEPDSVGLIP